MTLIKRLFLGSNIDFQQINDLLSQQSSGAEHGEIKKEDLYEILQNSLFYAFVAIDTENDPTKYLGTATIFFQRNMSGWIAEIHDVVVDENNRGKKLGEALVKKLLDTALEFSRTKNIKVKLYLTSRPNRIAANSLYQKLGFSLIAQSHGHWGTNLYKIIVKPNGFRGS